MIPAPPYSTYASMLWNYEAQSYNARRVRIAHAIPERGNIVPNPPAALDEKRFYEDHGEPAARAAIQHQLDEVSRALQ